MASTSDWLFWALLSAVFAALTSILAKVGIEGVDSDLATLIRTFVIVITLGIFVSATNKWTNPFSLGPKTLTFLVLSGLATCASWVCYFRALQMGEASRVAPVDKLSVVLVAVFAVLFLGERPSMKDWVGIALVGVGTVVLALR
ncbi:MAG: EamA family transporter [Firmicutes bacterium]|nr:EamA family transporter [Bacillota bacterium]